MQAEKSNLKLWTVGHSNYPMPEFIELIRRHDIEVIADVRSNPYSRYATHFHGPFLKKALAENNLKYVFLGNELGGKPKEAEFYDLEGHVDYAKLSSSAKFNIGMERLINGLRIYRVAIMCAEENPSECHRHLLISRVASISGIDVLHIRKGGLIEDRETLDRQNRPECFARQLSLLPVDKKHSQDVWRSSSRLQAEKEARE